MTKNIPARSNDELAKVIKKATEARKIVRKKMDDLFEEGWKFKSAKYRLDWLINESKEELGRRKAVKCGAMKKIKREEWGGYRDSISCAARELSFNNFSYEKELFRKHCCTCRWKPSQAKTRMVILRIKNGRSRR